MQYRQVIITASVLSCALAATSFAASGTPGFINNPSAYVDINAGAGNVNYQNDTALGLNHLAPALTQFENNYITSSWEHGNWTGAFGADVGVTANQYLGAEFGGYYFMSSTRTIDTKEITSPTAISAGHFTVKHQPWILYTAVKLTVPVVDKVHLFAKAGVSYTHQTTTYHSDAITSPAIPAQDLSVTDTHFAPMFAIGADYAVMPRCHVNLSYTHLGGMQHKDLISNDITIDTSKQSVHFNHTGIIPAMNLITAGISYQFKL